MAGRPAGQGKEDPSANVILLVGNATKYLEDLHKQSQDFLCQKMQAESKRIDANRENDTEAVKVANERAIKQAEVLANQMAENAEALRASMAKTAETLATQLQQVTTSLDNRLKIVEEKQYGLAGASKGSRDMWGWVSAGLMLILAVVAFFVNR